MRRIVALGSVAALLSVIPTGALAAGQGALSGVCDEAVRRHDTLQGLLALVHQLKDANPLWSSYHPATADYVFVIPAPQVQRCAAVWRDGALRSVFPLASAPRLDTPLYGFFRPARAADHPQELRDRLAAAGVREAVILPLDGDARLGFSMNSQSWFIDMAVHEAVHLLVQFPSRSGVEAAFRWPRWTVPQPDRAQLANRCYGSADPKEQRLAAERAPLLAAAMSAATGGSLESVCRDARTFVAERHRRWSGLSGVAVPFEDGAAARACAEGEAIMELNEGVPAFVAWLTARDLDVIGDDRLRAQFNVQQRDVDRHDAADGAAAAPRRSVCGHDGTPGDVAVLVRRRSVFDSRSGTVAPLFMNRELGRVAPP